MTQSTASTPGPYDPHEGGEDDQADDAQRHVLPHQPHAIGVPRLRRILFRLLGEPHGLVRHVCVSGKGYQEQKTGEGESERHQQETQYNGNQTQKTCGDR